MVNIFSIVLRTRSKTVKRALLFTPDHKDICVFDRIEILFQSLTYNKAKEFYDKYLREKHDQSEYWENIALYLIFSQLDEKIEEGLINEDILKSFDYEKSV